MRYQEYVAEYCQDLIKSKRVSPTDSDGLDVNFYHEDIIVDEGQNNIKVVYTEDRRPIPIVDIITQYPADFLKMHPNDIETYNRYMDMYEEESGIEAILSVRKQVQEELERIDEESEYELERFFR